jgi:hypothetical protein
MGDLHEQRTAAAEEQHALSVHAPGHRIVEEREEAGLRGRFVGLVIRDTLTEQPCGGKLFRALWAPACAVYWRYE